MLLLFLAWWAISGKMATIMGLSDKMSKIVVLGLEITRSLHRASIKPTVAKITPRMGKISKLIISTGGHQNMKI